MLLLVSSYTLSVPGSREVSIVIFYPFTDIFYGLRLRSIVNFDTLSVPGLTEVSILTFYSKPRYFLCSGVETGIHNAILSHFPAFSKTFISLLSEIIWQLADNTEHEFFISIMLPKDAFVMYELINNEY